MSGFYGLSKSKQLFICLSEKNYILIQATQEKNRVSSEMNELRDHLDIKDRKISVLQRKVCKNQNSKPRA